MKRRACLAQKRANEHTRICATNQNGIAMASHDHIIALGASCFVQATTAQNVMVLRGRRLHVGKRYTLTTLHGAPIDVVCVHHHHHESMVINVEDLLTSPWQDMINAPYADMKPELTPLTDWCK